jgi:hypothetical protein
MLASRSCVRTLFVAVFDPDCRVCRVRAVDANIAAAIDRSFAEGRTPHQIHRRLVYALGDEAPSRSSVYRHLVGDAAYLPHTSADERAQHERARARHGRELHGAALATVKASRSRPRGSQKLVEQVAGFLLARNLIPSEAFAQGGVEAPGAHRLGDPVFRYPEEDSLARHSAAPSVGRVAHFGHSVARWGR